jgi:tRNA-2-methylthio-N6-dimethylallyladenosine synthase
MRDLDAIEGDYTLRFMTSHPKDATTALMDAMAEGKHIAHHFHLPMQSGSDAILKKMNRHYDTARYLSIVDGLRARMPDITITSDIIVGFPGETEEDFEATLEMLRRVKFDMLFSFIYSPRPGTPAADMEDQVPDKVKNERFDRLLALQNEIALEKNQTMVGSTVRVLCDGVSKNNADVYSGRTDGNKIVFFPGREEDTGRFVDVRVDRAEAFALYGEKI